MDMYTAIQAATVGIGLVGCGYILGKAAGVKEASEAVMGELFSSKLLTPEQVATHYANKGHERARAIVATMNAAKRQKKEDE